MTVFSVAEASSGSRTDESPVSVLRADGKVDPDLADEFDVGPGQCRGFYRDMLLARRFDRAAFNLQRQGELGLWLSCEGQEAAQVGSIRSLRDSDYVFPSYREHAAAICRGLTPAEILGQWRGTAHGSWDPRRRNFHVNSLVLGTQLLHATGYAMGVRADGTDDIVLAYFGDGSASQGDASEALNWAAVRDAPLLFFCQNNQWAISTPVSAQSRVPLYARARGFGLLSIQVDGNDVLAVHAATRWAAQSLRAGGPPVLIEALTYRMQGHSTSDDARRYRDDDEVAQWRGNDPLHRLEILLRDQDWADETFFSEVEAEARELEAEVRSVCVELRPSPLEESFRQTLVTETALLRREREKHAAHVESLND